MIPANAITAWGVDHTWPTREQVEQDLLLSRAMAAIASDAFLGEELVFRGGTALHKLHLDRPYRYSEDLDYVRSSAGGIATLTQALTRLGTELVATKIRALYQRSKGRDVFDLWLALDHLHLDPSEILAALGPYRPAGITASKAIDNLARKLDDANFRHDLDPLVTSWPVGFALNSAAELISERLLDRLDE